MQLPTLATRTSSVYMASVISDLILPPVSLVAALFGAWRLAADPGWTTNFFITDGLLSHYQSWAVVAIGAQASAFIINRWIATQFIPVQTSVPQVFDVR
jgi:hypothetical protein